MSRGANSISVDVAQLKPMRIGQILDRGFKLGPELFKKLIVLYLISAILQAAQQLPQLPSFPAVAIVVYVASTLLAWYLILLVAVMAAEYWQGRRPERTEVEYRVTLKLAFRVFLLSLRISIVGGFGLLLFIIPGLVYFLNRILSVYILIIEDCSITEALTKSVSLMTKEKWYQTTSPIARVSGLTAIIYIMNIFAAGLIAGSSALLASNSISLAAMIAIMFIAFIFTGFISCYTNICYAGFYFDLLARYEGADLVTALDEIGKDEELDGINTGPTGPEISN